MSKLEKEGHRCHFEKDLNDNMPKKKSYSVLLPLNHKPKNGRGAGEMQNGFWEIFLRERETSL